MPSQCTLDPRTNMYDFADDGAKLDRMRMLSVIGWRLLDVMNRSMIDADDATLIRNLLPDVSGTVVCRLILR